MALKQGSKRQTRNLKAAAVSPDTPFTGGGVANSPDQRPGRASPGGRKRSEPAASRTREVTAQPKSRRSASPTRLTELETVGHAKRRDGTRNPSSPRKPVPPKSRRREGSR